MNIIRIYDSELENWGKKSKKEQKIVKRKILKETISNLSEYYQIFIDNLNGIDNIELDHIFNNERIDIFKSFINFGEELSKNIYRTLSYMKLDIKFSFGELNEETYIDKLINFLDKNESIKDSFNEFVKKQIGLKENEEDIILNIFKQNDRVRSNDKDIIGIINENLSDDYKKYLAKFYFNAETDNFFATLLSIEEEKKINTSSIEYLTKIQEEIKEDYFREFNIDKKNEIIENQSQNLIKLYLGLKIPKIVTSLKEIINFIKTEINANYIKNENNLRKENDTIKNNFNYENSLKGYNETLYKKIKEQPFLKEMNKENDQNKENELFNKFLEDYYTYFIFENVKNLREKKSNDKKSIKTASINDVKNFLKYLVDLKDKENKDKDPNIKIASKINWIECYKSNISTILQMFSSLSIVVKDLNNKIMEINKNDNILKRESTSSIVNGALFFAMESILRVVTSSPDIYISLKDNSNDFYELMNINQEILQNALKLEANLHLSTKEAYTLEEIIEILKVLSQTGEDKKENLIAIIKYLSEEAPLIINIKETFNSNVPELINIFNNLYTFLERLIGENEKFPKLMSIIFYNEYLKIPNNFFRNNLLDKITSRNDFIYNCYPLIKLILKGVGISMQINEIQGNLNSLINENNKLIYILNSKKNDFLDQIIIQLFEHLSLEFFENIEKIDKKTDKKVRECFLDFLEKKEQYENEMKNKKDEPDKKDKKDEPDKKDKKDKKDYRKYMIFGKSLNLFGECVEHLSRVIQNKEKTSNLSKLYSIAFIKVYLYKFIEFEFNQKYGDDQIKSIFDTIKTNNIYKNTNFMNVLFIYIIKIMYNLYNRNFLKLFNSDLIYRNDRNEYFKTIQLNTQNFLINYFVPLDENEEKEFNHGIQLYYTITDKKEKKDSEKDQEEISNSNPNEINNIDLFLSITINKLVSNLILKDFLNKNSQELVDYKKIGKFLNESLRKQNINPNLLKVLNLFYDKTQFLEILKKKFDAQCEDKEFIGEPYESLLYGLKFCAQSLLKINDENEEYFYASLISEKVKEAINKSYIPGNNAEKNKKLESLKILKDFLYNSSADTGYYVCSCGYLYSIGPCGFPTKSYKAKCPDCKKPIGYGKQKIETNREDAHGMVIRDGHYRIFKNLEQKKEQMSKFGDIDENIPNRTLEQYTEEVMNSMKTKSKKGIFKNSKSDFLSRNKSIRKMSKISYRLLNFILINHLFFSNCLEYISDDDLKNNYLIDGMNCLEIIQSNWNLLEEALKENNISSIQAFLNIIFKDLSELISNCKILEDETKLIEFEESVEKIVQSTIKKYPEYYEIYKKMNLNIKERERKDMNVNKDTDANASKNINENINEIINETYPPLPPKYPEKDLPLLKYFMYTEYKINFKKYLEQEEDFPNKYPLLNCYLNGSEEQKNLRYLPAFNEFTNSMVEKFSFHITREDAKDIELNKIEKYDAKKFNSFDKCWGEIYKYATKYKCRDEMEAKKLKANDKLIYFLNDDSEMGYGMYIAAACQKFICWQNNFLQPIIDSATFNGNLHYYIENMKKKVPVQEANTNQILSIDDCFTNSEYKDFDDLVYTFTKRDIYYNDKINYQNYNKFKFDFSMIEGELGKLILPEKCLFENEDKLNFIIYWGEGLRGGQSDTILKFYDKYPQVDLNEDERKNIYSSILKLFKANKNNFNSFFGSMQLLMFHLSNNLVPDKDMNSIIKNKPNYITLDESYEGFFSDKNFNINQLMNIFFYTEHLLFNELCKTLQVEYKKKIDDNVIEDIIKGLEIENENDKLPWKDLAAAIRRFISRYLVGDRQLADISENSELIFQLSRKDLWEEKYGKLENLEQLISDKMNKFKIKVGQAFHFYEIIGTEDKNLIVLDKENEKEKNVTQQVQNPETSNEIKVENNNINTNPDRFDIDNNKNNDDDDDNGGDDDGDDDDDGIKKGGLLD